MQSYRSSRAVKGSQRSKETQGMRECWEWDPQNQGMVWMGRDIKRTTSTTPATGRDTSHHPSYSCIQKWPENILVPNTLANWERLSTGLDPANTSSLLRKWCPMAKFDQHFPPLLLSSFQTFVEKNEQRKARMILFSGIRTAPGKLIPT